MAEQRIKGQDIEVRLVLNGSLLDTLTAVKDLELVLKLERLQEGYLGEGTDRYDEIFKGVQGSMTIHWTNKKVFDLFWAIVNRAKRREPGTVINLQATFNFPNGDRPRVLIPDLFFGDIPLATGGRDQYSATKLDFATSDAQPLAG